MSEDALAIVEVLQLIKYAIRQLMLVVAVMGAILMGILFGIKLAVIGNKK